MALPRKHNLDQLKKLRAITKGQDIGDIVAKGEKKKEANMPNAYWMDNPFDRNVDTYENFIKSDNKIQTKAMTNEGLNFEDDSFVIWENYLSQNEEFVNKNNMNIELIVDDIIEQYDYKEGIDDMRESFYNLIKNYFDMELIEESLSNKGKGPGNTSFFTSNPKQVLTSQISPSLLQIGKYVKVGKIEGYIDSVDEEFVYISSTSDDGKKEKITFKKFLKGLEDVGVIKESSGLPSEFWTEELREDYGVWSDLDDYAEPAVEPERIQREVQVQEEEEQEYEYEDDEYELDDNIRRIGPKRGPKTAPRRITTDPDKFDNPGVKEFPNTRPRRGTVYGTEDDPLGLKHESRLHENIYKNDFKSVKCDDCGQMVEDTYKAKVAHVYNKHFNKPSMDGAVPTKKGSYDVTWPQGGKATSELVLRYFPKN